MALAQSALNAGRSAASYRAQYRSNINGRMLAKASRLYWTGRHPRTSSSSSTYDYFSTYPQRRLPRYEQHAVALDYRYMKGNRRGHCFSNRRRASNWAPEDDPKYRSGRRSHWEEAGQDKTTNSEVWETHTRIAGEKYLRQMEEHIKLMRRDPYWGMFGASELRGVWNPWRKYYEMHTHMTQRATPSQRVTRKVDLPEAEQHPASTSKLDQATEPEVNHEYLFDPITNRKVRRDAHNADNLMNLDKVTSIDVKVSKPDVDTLKPISASSEKAAAAPITAATEEHSALAGFAKQPWLVQEGFISNKNGTANTTREAPSINFNDPARSRPIEKASNQATQRPVAPPVNTSLRSLRLERMSTTLDQPLAKTTARSLDYDKFLDRGEDLEHLRASDIRASSTKTVSGERSAGDPPELRWSTLEKVAAKLYKDREDRLNREFAADRWRVTRSWSAYPGEIPQTPQERQERRAMLEKAFQSSLNKFEMDMLSILGNLGVKPSGSEQEMSIHSAGSMRSVARFIQTLREQIQAKRIKVQQDQERQRRKRADVLLQKEVDQAKAAMSAHENRPHIVAPISAPVDASASSHSAEQALEASIKEFEAIMQNTPKSDEHSESVLMQSGQDLTAESGSSGKLPSVSADQNAVNSPTQYILLAYNKAEKKIQVVRTTSSKWEEASARRTISSILGRLDDPAKYFDHIERLESAGFELVAGSRKMLVYKDKINRDSKTLPDVESSEAADMVRGWGSPKREGDNVSAAAEKSKVASKDSAIKSLSSASVSRRIRRLEDKFSGPGPRFTEAPPGEKEQLSAKSDSRSTSRKNVLWRIGMAAGLLYTLGVFMEWSKERDRERLTREYQQEVRRVKEIERRRAQEHTLLSRWGF